MSEQPSPSSASGRRRNVGFVELPDEALDVFSHYTQLPDWDCVLVVSQVYDSYAVRMAEILQIPVLDVANRLSLLACDRVIVGNRPASLLASIQELLAETAVEVVALERALKELGMSAAPAPEGSAPEGEALAAGPLDDGLWGEPLAATGGVDPEVRGERENDSGSLAWKRVPDSPVVPDASRRARPDLEPISAAGDGDAVDGPALPVPMDTPPAPGPAADDGAQTGVDSEPELESAPPAETPAPVTGSAPAEETAPLPVPGPAEESDPAAGTETGSPMPEAAPVAAGFDSGSLLGEELGRRLGPLALDPDQERMLADILGMAARATHAGSGSIMLLDRDARNLRIAVAVGLPAETVAAVRRPVGEGVAGTVFATGSPRVAKHPAPGASPDAGGDESASVPILSEGRPIGVLNVTLEPGSPGLDEKAVALLTRFAKEASGAVLKALDLHGLEDERRREALLGQVDRLMGLQESLPVRLKAVGDVLGQALRADFVHFFVVDPLGRRLEIQTPPRGTTVWHPRSQPLDRGFFGLAMRAGRPQSLSAEAGEGEEPRAAMACLPIRTSRPRGLIVLENLPFGPGSVSEMNELLEAVGERVEALLRVEEGVEAQELLYQLKMRVTDQIPQLAALPPVQRTRSALELAVQLLAGEAAIWVPPHGARPVTSEPHNRRVSTLLAEARSGLDLLAEFVREKGAVAGGADAPGWDPRAPKGPAPYVGVAGSSEEGVLILFFAPDETAGSPAQVSPEVMIDLLLRMADLCSPEFRAQSAAGPTPVPPAAAPTAGASAALDPRAALPIAALRRQVHQEWIRSRRYGHSFALTRFALDPAAAGDDPARSAILRAFLLREKRDVDLLSEVGPAAFVILSPEVDRHPDGVRKRLTDKWRTVEPELVLRTDQRIFPRDGHAENLYQGWIGGDGPEIPNRRVA